MDKNAAAHFPEWAPGGSPLHSTEIKMVDNE